MLSALRRVFGYLGDSAGLRTCAVCGDELTAGERLLCITCLGTLPRTARPTLPVRYADIFANGVAPQGLTEAWFDYRPGSDPANMIIEAKYHDRPAVAREAGRVFGRELLRYYGAVPVDVLLPVPMYWRKRMRRGYNQSEEIARGLSEVTGIAIGDNLRAVRAHSTQTHKSDSERRENVKGSVAVDHPEELSGLRIAIVDDIVTTGSTISECVAAISMSAARTESIGMITLGATVKKV